MNCLNEGVLRAYVDQELTVAECQEVESHLGSCAGCREQAAALSNVGKHVEAQLHLLEAPLSSEEREPEAILAGFKARFDAEEEKPSLLERIFAKRWRPAWIASAVAAVLLVSLAFPSGRGLAQRLLSTLRVERVQTVNLDLSSLDGNRGFQQRLGKMLSDKTVVTTDEKSQTVTTADAASQLTGFEVKTLSGRDDTPNFRVEGTHAIQMTLDRSRLQDILDQAGRSDLLLPPNLDGATVSVRVPRSVELEYGNCHRKNDGYADRSSTDEAGQCTFVMEAPSPEVNVPADLNLQQLAEIALELGGMTPTQAREFCQTVDWKSTLVLPIPRFMGSSKQVTMNGVQGTLLRGNNRGGSEYVLIWVKDGMIYCLGGNGDSSKAVELASTLN